jgi:hypothetical protein
MRIFVGGRGELTDPQYLAGVRRLREDGMEVIATEDHGPPGRRREVELVLPLEDGAGDVTTHVLARCAAAFGVASEVGVTTFISRGTDDDVHGVLQAFGLDGTVTRDVDGDVEVVAVVLDAASRDRVPESRLHTALEATLNCEVQIRYG